MAVPRVLFVMADYGHDPTETAVPFLAFRDAGFKVSFITETGKSPECDKKMLEGWTQKLLGATAVAVKSYEEMKTHPSYSTPLSWTSPTFSFRDFNMLFFPGGHDKAVRQVIDSPIIQQHLAAYFPSTAKPSNHAVVAICHGVLAVANAKYDSRVSDGEKWAGKSVLYDVTTTTLPGTFESGIFWGTRAVLGDYYKTYGAGSENVETSVRKVLDDPSKQYKCSIGPGPFVIEDEKYNYLSGRFPGDAELLAQKAVEMARKAPGL